MKASKETVQRIYNDISVVANQCGMSAKEMREAPMSILYTAYHVAYGHRTWADDHPNIKRDGRWLDYTPDTPLYPDDMNDDTLRTALRAVQKMF